MFRNKGEEKQRFSLRKLSVGVASVLLGVTFMTFGGQTVHADQTTSTTAETVEAKTAAQPADSVATAASDKDATAAKSTAPSAVKTAASQANAAIENTKEIAKQTVADPSKQATVEPAADKIQAQDQTKQQTKAAPKISEADLQKFLGLDQPDALSDSQLKAMGLDHDTYLGDGAGSYVAKGVKYKAEAVLTIYSDDTFSKVIATYKFIAHHDAQGQIITADEMNNTLQVNCLLMHNDKKYEDIASELNNAAVDVRITPMQTASPIYINKGHQLDPKDAMRSLTGEMSADSASWIVSTIGKVDINKPGIYQGAVAEAIYKNGTGTTVGVPVVVVDLQGNNIYTHQGAKIPTAISSITGQPDRSTASWISEPSTAKAGDTTGTVQVTYPDGNVGQATVIFHVLAPTGHDVTITLGDPAPTAESIITNNGDLNDKLPGTTYSWKKEPDVSKPGKVNGTVIVTYPDGQTAEVPTVITILDVYTSHTETKTITRKIVDNVPRETPTVTNQTVVFTRTVTQNSAGQVTKQTAWQANGAASWSAYTAKGAAGYTPTTAVVSAQAVTADTDDSTVVINYNANDQKQLINYVDNNDHSKVVYSDSKSGKTDQTISYHAQAPQGWRIVPGQNLPTEITFKATTQDPIIIYVDHASQTVSDSKQVSRTVAFINPYTGQKQTLQIQNVTLTRTGSKDAVTNEITWGAWSTDRFAQVSAPDFTGYTVANPNAAGAVLVNGDTQNSEVVFTYNANDLNQKINYIDIYSGTVVKSDSVKGKTRQKGVAYHAVVPENWQLVAGQTLPTSFDFGYTNPSDYNIYIEHGKQNIKNADSKTVTRDIYQVEPTTGNKKLLQRQTATVSRDGVKDLVTGEITYGPWTTSHFDNYAAPQLAGYYLISSYSAPWMMVTADTPNSEVDFTYAAMWHTQVVNYLNKADHSLISSQNFAGRTGSHLDFTPQIPDGWVLSKGQSIPSGFDFGTTDPAPINIYLEHGTADYPFGTNKTVTRAIYAQIAGHKIFVKRQSVQLVRTAKQDLVTGEVSYSAWSHGNIDKVIAPEYAGYVVTNPDAAPAVVVDGSQDKLADVVFNYKNAEQSVNVKYVEQNTDHVIKTDTVAGKVGESVAYQAQAPAGWTIVPGQEVPTQIGLTAGTMPDIIIYVEHGKQTLPNDTKDVTRTVLAQDQPLASLVKLLQKRHTCPERLLKIW